MVVKDLITKLENLIEKNPEFLNYELFNIDWDGEVLEVNSIGFASFYKKTIKVKDGSEYNTYRPKYIKGSGQEKVSGLIFSSKGS